MPSDSDKAVIPATLDYAVEPSRWRWRSRRAIQFLLLVGLIFAGWRWGPQIWARTTLLYWQRQCLNYSPSPDMVILQANPAAAQALLQTSDYRRANVFHMKEGKEGAGNAPVIAFHRHPPAWDELAQRSPHLSNTGSPNQVTAICFMGELKTPAGEQFLVIVQTSLFIEIEQRNDSPSAIFQILTVSPVTFLERPGQLSWPVEKHISAMIWSLPKNIRIFAGQRDPQDPSRFSIRYQAQGQEGFIDGWIANNGSINLQFRGPPPKPTNPTTGNSQ